MADPPPAVVAADYPGINDRSCLDQSIPWPVAPGYFFGSERSLSGGGQDLRAMVLGLRRLFLSVNDRFLRYSSSSNVADATALPLADPGFADGVGLALAGQSRFHTQSLPFQVRCGADVILHWRHLLYLGVFPF